MGKHDSSRKLIIIYALSYIFISLCISSGVYGTEERLGESNIKLENVRQLAFIDVFTGAKNYEETTKNIATQESDEDIANKAKALEFAKGILTGSFVNGIVTNDQVIKNNGLGLIKVPTMEECKIVEFSGDKIVLAEQSSAEENIVVEEPIVEQPQVVVNGVPTNYTRYIDCTATAYCLCKKCTGKTPGSSGYGRTASGHVIVPGNNEKIIAVDRKQIPLGTNVYVEGLNGAPSYGFALAADTGGAIKGNKIDLYYDSHAECLKWGRRQVRVYILPNE